jgi:2-aminoethylphosphonate transport system permease protein
VLVWSRSGRAGIWAFAALLIGVIYGAPIIVIALASIGGHWNGVWPSDFTLRHYAQAFEGSSADELRASVVTGVAASALALCIGTWAALAIRTVRPMARRVFDLFFFVPSAVPSVSVGLGLLVAFSRPPILLNGTTTIVIVAHLVLVSAFTYGSVSAGLAPPRAGI